MTINSPEAMADAVTRARAIIAERQARAAVKAGTAVSLNYANGNGASVEAAVVPINTTGGWQWNTEQQKAIDLGVNKSSFCLIGAAGTGKTTNLRGLLKQGLESHVYPPLEAGTKWLTHGSPGIVLVSFTRRAVRNIAKQMPPELKDHCITLHKLLEYGPEFYEEYSAEKKCMVNKMRFAPQRHYGNPLPRNLLTIVIDESSMVDTELVKKLLDALPFPARVQFIFLGDLNQLPPVYGQAILGQKLLELPIVELTQVYRQALESPIIALALAVKNNNFKSFNKDAVDLWGAPAGFNAANIDKKHSPVVLHREGRGKVTLQPWKVQWEQEDALRAIQGQINKWITDGVYSPDEDLMLCPWNKSFGIVELNKGIANKLGKDRKAVVHEVIAGYNKYYLAVGDKVVIDKNDAIILEIKRNPRYMGHTPQPASVDLDRYGSYALNAQVVENATDMLELTDEDIDAQLAALASTDEVQDRTTDASHRILVRFPDLEDEEEWIDKSAYFNSSQPGSVFGYATTVHKAQGSECRRVFFITHYCHSAMCYRELVYTAVTRAAEELHIICTPQMLGTAAKNARIKGDTLQAKLAYYTAKMKEKIE